MFFTISEMEKELEKYKERNRLLASIEEYNSTYDMCNGEEVDIVRPKYDYEKTQKELKENIEVIMCIKYAIDNALSTFTVPEYNMTLDELKMYIEYLDKRISRLYSLKMCSFFNRSMCDGIIEYEDGLRELNENEKYEYRNFDIEEVEKDYDDATLELRRAKDTLYKYLATEEFETDCLEVVYEDSDDTE